VSHSSAPLLDHKQIILKLGNSQETANLRGYWKFNNSLLQDVNFNDNIKKIIEEIFNDNTNCNFMQKWEYFKYMARCAAIKRSKELKFLRNQKESELFNRINILLTKSTVSSEEEVELKESQLKIDQMYKDLAKGAFIRSRAKWLEEGETNSSYFFALEKRNGRRCAISF